MKKIAPVIILAVIFIMACSEKSEAPRYAKDTPEYSFFKTLAEKDSLLNPDQSNILVRTTKYTITTNDIMPDIYSQLSPYASNLANFSKEMVQNSVKQMADAKAIRELTLLGAANRNITVEESEVQAAMEQYYTNSGGKEAFINRINQMGFTIEYVEKDVEKNLIVTKYRDAIIDDVEVTDEEIETAHNQGKTATVRHILKLTQGKTDAEKTVIYEEMEKILEKARAGEDFAELAKQYSEDPGSKDNGGLYENFARGEMVKPFEDASFSLPINSISDIVETTYGYHIIQIVSREKETRPFEEVKEEIRQSLLGSKQMVAYQKTVEDLKEKYQYEILY